MSCYDCNVSGRKGNTHTNIHTNVDITTFTEILYLVVIAAYVSRAFLDTTLFYWPWPENSNGLLRFLACIVIFLKLTSSETSILKEWPLHLLTIIVLKLSWVNTDYGFLLDIALLAMGAINISYKKILKVGFWTGLFILGAAMLGSFAGSIPDLVYLGDDMFKHSLGIVYSTDFAAHVAFLLLTGWVLYGKWGVMPFVAFALVLCAYVHCYNGAKCSTIILLLSATGMLYIFLTERYKERFSLVRKLANRVDRILIYTLPLCAFTMLFLTLCYSPDNNIVTIIDRLLSNRLHLGKMAIDKHGITFFGTPFPQIGFGGTTAWSWAMEYSFVDCSYVLILVRYGVTVFAVICVHAVCLSKKAYRCKDRRLLLAMALVAVHSIIEHHLPEIAYNLFLLLPFADYEKDENGFNETLSKTDKLVSYIVALCVGTTVMAMLPRFITYLKTLVDLQQLDLKENHLIFLFISCGCMLWLFFLSRGLFKVAVALVNKVFPPKNVMLGLAALLLIFAGTFLKWEDIIRKGLNEHLSLIENDKPILEMLLQNGSTSKVYIDHISEIYKREFCGISDMIISSEGLATKKDVSLITENNRELWILMAAGYEYGELSSGHAIYTNSEEHKALLEKAGIKMEDYYYKETNWSMQSIAKQNNLQVTDAGSVLLTGQAKSLLHGPGVTIYNGTLRVIFKIKLITPPSSDSVVATVKLTSDWGLHTWKQQNILLSDFNANGECAYTLEYDLRFNCPNMEFILTVSDEVQLELQGVTYGKKQSRDE